MSVYKALKSFSETGSTKKLQKQKTYLKRMRKKLLKNLDDQRSGEETYGYESLGSCMSQAGYISDRWKTPFRIKWILDGLELGRFEDE